MKKIRLEGFDSVTISSSFIKEEKDWLQTNEAKEIIYNYLKKLYDIFYLKKNNKNKFIFHNDSNDELRQLTIVTYPEKIIFEYSILYIPQNYDDEEEIEEYKYEYKNKYNFPLIKGYLNLCDNIGVSSIKYIKDHFVYFLSLEQLGIFRQYREWYNNNQFLQFEEDFYKAQIEYEQILNNTFKKS
jgi:hypothetical protein